MSVIDQVHGGYVFSRRIQVLSRHFAELLPRNARVLDVGCGDGSIASLIMKERPDVTIEGIDVLVREQTAIPVKQFNGITIPYAENSYDAVTFIDVLHHTEDPAILLKEAARVARDCIVIKDHTRNGLLANSTLRFMDWVGNARHGVVLPYNYWSKKQWMDACNTLDLTVDVWKKDVGLYPPPASWVFGRSLHFIGRFGVPEA